MASNIPTEFAPAERVSVEIVHRQADSFNTLNLSPGVLNAMLNYVLVLNQQRQIIFATQNILQLTAQKELTKLLGLRPGEALNCVHSDDHVGGCGTSKFCSECGAVKAILAALAGYKDLQECRLTRIIDGKAEALDLLVYTTPFLHNEELFTLVCVSDISHLKRRRALERVFFHDVINTAGGLAGLLDQVVDEAPHAMRSDVEIACRAAHDVLEQVFAQKDLVQAETSELVTSTSPLTTLGILRQVTDLYRKHPISEGREVKVLPGTPDIAFVTDPTLLKRVLGNLVKNALEAIRPGEAVDISTQLESKRVEFLVHNPGTIPEPVQIQIFNRSFTTKGNGRGLGTYSVKLLTEHYLKGDVRFVTSAEAGTTFIVSLPRNV